MLRRFLAIAAAAMLSASLVIVPSVAAGAVERHCPIYRDLIQGYLPPGSGFGHINYTFANEPYFSGETTWAETTMLPGSYFTGRETTALFAYSVGASTASFTVSFAWPGVNTSYYSYIVNLYWSPLAASGCSQ